MRPTIEKEKEMREFLIIREEKVKTFTKRVVYVEAIAKAEALAAEYPHITWHVVEKRGVAKAVRSTYTEHLPD